MGIAYFPPEGKQKIKAEGFSIGISGLNFSMGIPQLDLLVDHGFLRKLEIDKDPKDGKPSSTGKSYEGWKSDEPVADSDLKKAAEETKRLVAEKAAKAAEAKSEEVKAEDEEKSDEKPSEEKVKSNEKPSEEKSEEVKAEDKPSEEKKEESKRGRKKKDSSK